MTRSLKIAWVFYDRPDYFSGPLINARRMLVALRERGHTPVGLAMYLLGNAPTAEYLRSQGIECRVAPFEKYTEDNVRWILEQLADVNPDVFVPNLSVAGWFAARWAREAGIPTIAAQRADDQFYWQMVQQFVVGPAAWAVNGLVSVNHDLRRRVAEMVPARTRQSVIPSGVPVPAAPVARHAPLRLVYLGRLVEEKKCISHVVAVMAAALERLPEATAVLVGTGPEQARIEQLIRERDLTGRMECVGGVASEAIPERLSGGSIVLLLSDSEGTPGALMDAMAAGLVPVCRDVPGGVRELVRHEETGLLVDESIDSAVAAVVRLAGDVALWNRLSANARRTIEQDFSLQSAAGRWEAFCEELLRDAGPRRPIRLPSNLHLPPPLPGLDVEDRRRETVWQRASRLGLQKGRGLMRRLMRIAAWK